MPMYAQNGYAAPQVRRLFDAGLAQSFAVYRDEEPMSICLAHCNHAAVWQVDALYTADNARGQGLANEVLQTALQTLLDAGRIPRFQMNEKNIVSRRLAESLGLQRRLSTGHFIATPR
jgi:predicted GNAT family acetyltransferase